MPDGGTKRRSKQQLLGVTPDLIKPRKPKILIYGASGVGKTWVSLDWPDVYYFDVESGATQREYREKLKVSRGTYLGADEGAASFEVVLDQIMLLATESHDRRTIVIDSITKLFANEIAREAERLKEANKKNEFSTDKKPAVSYMRQLVRWITKIDMNVILICGEVPEWGKDANGDSIQIGRTFDCWPRLEYELDLAIQVVRLGSSFYGKVRKTRVAAFPFAETFDWNYSTFATMYGRDVVEGASSPVDVATPEQLAEINRLLEIVKLDEGQVDKWLAAANVPSWDEMATDRAAKAIGYLKGRINP